MGAQYELSTNLDSIADTYKSTPLFENAYDSMQLGYDIQTSPTSSQYLPSIMIADCSGSTSGSAKDQQVLDAVESLYSNTYSSQRSDIDGYDDKGTFWNGRDGQVTRDSIREYLAEAETYPETRYASGKGMGGTVATDKATRYPDELIEKLKTIDENWDSQAMEKLKNSSGNLTWSSVDSGKKELWQDIDQSTRLERIERYHGDMESIDSIDRSKRSETDCPRSYLSVSVTDAATVRKGEGPYQSAERLLSLDGQPANHEDVLALAHALAGQFTEDQQAAGASGDLAGLRVRTQLVSNENQLAILARISDPTLRERVASIMLWC